MNIAIDKEAGFCFGVVSAIKKLEEELQKEKNLYCLGDIVHNNMEVERLVNLGLKTIDNKTFSQLENCKVMIRAHGEPPSTYKTAKQNNIEIIDATCPMVLKLQKDVRQGYEEMRQTNGQVVIFGKKGHAEVVGLEGQTDNTAIVVSSASDLEKIDFSRPIHIYSQTTKNREDYERIIELIKQKHLTQQIYITDSICKKVSLRAKSIEAFAKSVDCILFVSGKNSSNGMYLYELCKKNNKNTFFVSDVEDLNINAIKGFENIGISGATSTPMWLMEKVKDYVLRQLKTE
ncbi:MAG: 4-hydroxy-3-methylbut-2-enyl diphosphate reductase [Bacteroidales bacterium]|mgnify:CR=1 FL=1|nr:4-hydroxy-3-methylbut-2-enyl diphosphate reductase [Bacteroidales bacterium]